MRGNARKLAVEIGSIGTRCAIAFCSWPVSTTPLFLQLQRKILYLPFCPTRSTARADIPTTGKQTLNGQVRDSASGQRHFSGVNTLTTKGTTIPIGSYAT